MSDVRRLAAAALVAVLSLVVISSCQDDKPAPSATAPTDPSTPLESFSTKGIAVQRDAFCSGIGPNAAAAALGTMHYRGVSYNNGDHARLTPGVRDVAHEFDCAWRARDGSVAQAWVFAPPVTRAQAKQLKKSELGRGCVAARGPAFGGPSVATRCELGNVVQEGYFGLFGDAWLSCTLSTPKPGPPDLSDRTSRWCVEVVKAASGQTPEG